MSGKIYETPPAAPTGFSHMGVSGMNSGYSLCNILENLIAGFRKSRQKRFKMREHAASITVDEI